MKKEGGRVADLTEMMWGGGVEEKEWEMKYERQKWQKKGKK